MSLYIRSHWPSWVALFANVLLSAVGPLQGGCDTRTSQERVRGQARQEIARNDQLNREWQQTREQDIARVRRYKNWFARLATIDHVSLGLPAPEFLPDGSIRPATGSATFCQRVVPWSAAEQKPTSEQWIAAYRQELTRFLSVTFPESYDAYRQHYLAERRLARLACSARADGTVLQQSLLGLLAPVDSGSQPGTDFDLDTDLNEIAAANISDGIRYTAAIYTINHDIDPDRGWQVLRELRDSDSFFSEEVHEKLETSPSLLSLGFDLHRDYQAAIARLRNDWKGRPLRNGNVRRATPW